MVSPKRHSRPGYGSPGESTHLRPKGTLARGMARPGKAPTSGSPEVLRPRCTQGFDNLPEDRPGLGETPYTTTASSLCTNGVVFPYYPGRAGVPSSTRGFTSTFRTLPNIRCGLWKQAPQSTESTIKLLIRFRLSRITLHTYYTTLSTTPANYNSHIYIYIYISKYSPDESHNSSYDNNNLHPLSPSARDKLPHVSCHRRSRHQSWWEPATPRGC